MVCPERMSARSEHPRCFRLAGESPVAVSAGAPRSRPRAHGGEIPPPEWGVKSLQGVVWLPGREQVHGPSMKRTLQPRDRRTRKGELAEPIISRRRQQTEPNDRRSAGRPRGMEESMRRQPEMEQGRPYPSAFVRRSDSHKWNAKRSSWREGVRGAHSTADAGGQSWSRERALL